jgi:hypothetical protein
VSPIATDVQTAATEVANGADKATDDVAEALARNIATQQGEEQFKNAGHELMPLTCDAAVEDGIAKIDVNCTEHEVGSGSSAHRYDQ